MQIFSLIFIFFFLYKYMGHEISRVIQNLSSLNIILLNLSTNFVITMLWLGLQSEISKMSIQKDE